MESYWNLSSFTSSYIGSPVVGICTSYIRTYVHTYNFLQGGGKDKVSRKRGLDAHDVKLDKFPKGGRGVEGENIARRPNAPPPPACAPSNAPLYIKS